MSTEKNPPIGRVAEMSILPGWFVWRQAYYLLDEGTPFLIQGWIQAGGQQNDRGHVVNLKRWPSFEKKEMQYVDIIQTVTGLKLK